MPTTTPNRPAYKSQAGPLQLSTWANELPDGAVGHVTYLTRSYQLPPEKREGADDDGWRKTNGLRKWDLLAASEMLRLAYLRVCMLELLNTLNDEEEG
ncbi:hypothetical protein [Botrimarina mediterranea]|uniref:Uncharacterized protein n=1 Tax=Botrimarina mediterranea TaxID=2528022 RepID=A0A518K9S4_9BACT|nr:hypothetical protein [Botrimarina mediterranea]QDV74544.1 hypothetical protein Spa11_27480 [Botrimarina mediterranea]QDV79184.1 hypothetical protein K2D_27950 [Planctomycetes bacterium K2D]